VEPHGRDLPGDRRRRLGAGPGARRRAGGRDPLLKRGLSPFLLVLTAWASASAHEIGSAKVEITLAKDGRYAVVAKIDPEHVPPGPLRDSREELRRRFVAEAQLAFDGVQRELTETAASAATPLPDSPAFILRFEGKIPAESKTLTFREGAAIGWYLVQVVNEGTEGSVSQWLDVGQESKAFPIASSPPPPTVASTVGQYVVLGYEHILPKGLDHILFVLGLFLMSTLWKALLAQVTAFTVAHSITLGLAIYGAVSLPSSVVEPLIAASIVYVAVENVLSREVHKSRIALVFCFGLLHGLGFAGVLHELGLPRSQFLPALLSFNLGVELGQLSVIALAFLALGWWGSRPWYRRRVVIPGSLAIAAVGLYWTIQRIF
jgi:HupE/UreJ protein